MQKVLFPLALALILGLSGCASIFNDKTQQINVTSSTGQQIQGTFNGLPYRAPAVLTVARQSKDKIIITDTPGCQRVTVVNRSVDSMFYLNFLGLGVFGSSTDYATGKMWKYDNFIVVSCRYQ